MVAAGMVGLSAPPGGADCPIPAHGVWTGLAVSEGGGSTFDLEFDWSFDGGVITGTLRIDGDSGRPVSGTVDCGVITVGAVDVADFDGTFSPDGRSVAGTFSGVVSGTWSASATTSPYVLSATSAVEPMSITPSSAASWAIDVENTGGTAAPLTRVTFEVQGAGVIGDLRDSSVTQGTGCTRAIEFPETTVHCDLGAVPPGETEGAAVTVVSTGGAGTSIEVTGFVFGGGGGTDDTTEPVTISVVAPENLPPNVASAVVPAGGTITLGTKATPETPLVVKFKLPKKVAAGTTVASGRSSRSARRSVSIDGAQLMVVRRPATGSAASQIALGRPKAPKVFGPSVPISLSRSAREADTFCGGSACTGEVIHLTSFAGYNDRKRPAKITMTWDGSQRGRGTASTVYKRGDAKGSRTRAIPACLKTKAGYVSLPCVSKRKQLKNGDVQFIVLLLSGDPKFGRR
jgi:hypothetical protein